MRHFKRIGSIAPAAALLLLAAHPTLRKDPIGVYGVIDRVVLEPAEGTPERIQLWGVFAVARTFEIENGQIKSIDMGSFRPPQRGYLYYTVNRSDELATREDWKTLSALAGTGQPVAFGEHWPPAARMAIAFPKSDAERIAYMEWIDRHNGRVRRAGETPSQPDTFPLRGKGIPADLRAPMSRAIAFALVMVPETVSPADGSSASSGRVQLVARNLDDPSYLYHFEIVGANGSKEASGPIAAGQSQTVWSPKMKLRAGEGYTWRVWVKTIGTGETFPPAEAPFRAKD
jgi:hypothetical protein